MKAALRLAPALRAFFVVALIALALRAIYTVLARYRWADFARYAGRLPGQQIAIAVALTMAGYLVMTGYDMLALCYINRALQYRKVALASFTGFAINNNCGFSGLVGTSLRYRFYRGWGFTVAEMAKVYVFCSVSYWLGFILLGGTLFILQPPPIAANLHLRFASARLLGAVLLAPGIAYFLWVVARRHPLRVGSWEFALPGTPVFVGQVAISMADWALAGFVLYTLLPRPLRPSFTSVLGAFLLAQIAGLVSHVPGGLGVFEAVALVCLETYETPNRVIGALLAFRGVYFLMPLILALLILAVHEAVDRLRKRGTGTESLTTRD